MFEWNLRPNCKKREPVSQRLTREYMRHKIGRLAMSQFSWTCEELPNVSLIERYLWEDGRAMIWKSKELGWIVTRCIETGWNINGNANQWRPQFDMDIEDVDNPILNEDDLVGVVYDLPNHFMRRRECLFMCDDVADMNETLRQQVFNQKTPMIGIAANQADKQRVKQVMMDIHDNAKALIIDNDIMSNFSTIDFNAPFNVEELWGAMKSKEYEMLEYLGIDSQMAFQKKERMLMDEQEANDEIINLLLNDALSSRKHTVDILKSKGLNIDVKITDNVRPIAVINDGKNNGVGNGTDQET